MNGNFEYDKGSYPYGTVRIGDNYKLARVNSGDVLYEGVLPKPVAESVALRINAVFWSRDDAKLAEILTRIPALVKEEAHNSYLQQIINGDVAQQVIDKATEAEAKAK